MRPCSASSTLLAAAGMAALFAGPAIAADPDELETLKQTVRELQRKLEELDQQVDQKVKKVERNQELANEDVAKKLKDAPVVTASEKGFGIRSANKDFEVRLRGLGQIDYRAYGGSAFDQTTGNAPVATDGFVARRLRPTIEGTLFGRYGFRFNPDFGDSGDGSDASGRRQNKVRVVEAYLDINADDALKFRIGKHRPMVGLERVQSSGDLKFIERSYVSNSIIPNYDLGLSAFGDVLGKRLSYAVGFFNGVQDGSEGFTSADNNSDKDFAWRLFATPFVGGGGWLDGLGFGVGGTWSDDSNTNPLSGYRTAGLNTFFAYDSAAKSSGSRTRVTPQAYYFYGPLGVMAEYAHVSQDLTKGATQKDLQNDAWQIAATYLLTGEDASYRGIKPSRPFKFGEASGWGAWEIGLRYQENNLDRSAVTFVNAGKGYALGARTMGVGLTWYHNENSKFVVNYEDTRLEDVVERSVLRGDRERFLAFGYQVAY